MLVEVDPAVRVRLGKDRMTGKARGFAFAEFSDPAKAADAIRRFDQFELQGRKLRVNDAEDKPPARAPRPPMGRPMGGPSPGVSTFQPSGGFDSGFGGGGFSEPAGDRGFHNKKGGSRRGLRARKRSLRY